MSRFFLHYCVLCLSWAGRCFLAGIILFCLILLVLRHWILPDIGEYRSDIAAAITRVAGQPVQIDAIQANWDGLRPHLSMQGVNVYDRQGHLVLAFPRIEGTVSWRSLLRGELNFHEIAINRPALVTRRDKEGLLHIAGISLSGDQQESGFFDWLLRQRRLMIRQAVIYWLDDLQQGAVHYFEAVNLRLQNRKGGKRHQFGLQATSSGSLFFRMDIRGDLTGDSVQTLSAWQGRLFVQLQNVDLKSWQEWIPPQTALTLEHGRGSIRAWMDIDAGRLSRWTADINLRKAAVRFAQHLAPLEIDHLYGRSGWSRTKDAQDEQWFVRDFNIELKGAPRSGPIAASWHVLNSKDSALPEYNLQAEKIDLAILTRLASSLPLENTLHQILSTRAPHGTVRHANVRWRGDWSEQPPFRVNVAFDNLAVQPFDSYPAFNGVSGVVSATKTDGSLILSSRNVVISKKQPSAEKMQLDTLSGRVDWKIARDGETTRLKLNNIAFTGEAGSGILQGKYVLSDNASGSVDLTGRLSQADIPLLSHYATWLTGTDALDEINKTVVSGRLRNAEFHIRGTLNNQPGGKDGLSIRAETAIDNVSIGIADGWPKISNMAGRASIQDGALDMSLVSADVSGIKLQEFTLQSDDLYAKQPEIRIKGKAEGESNAIAALLRKAALNQHFGELLNQAEFSGKGRLQAEALLSVAREKFSVDKIQGRYQFIDNRINLDRYVPDFYQVNGSLIFTETSVALEGMRAWILGGPVRIASAPAPEGGVHITATGRADFDRFRRDESANKPVNLSHLWTQFAQGGSDWRLNIAIARDQASIVIESLLSGVTLAFPAPVTKTAEEVVPLRLERYFTWPHDDRIRLRYGDIVTAEFQRVHEGVHYYHPVRGVVRFGGKGVLPQDRMTRIEGAAAAIEWDQWRELFRRHAQADTSIDNTARGLDNVLTGPVQFDLKIGQFEFLSSYFNDVHLVADRRDNSWQMQVSSREVAGEIDWHAAAPQKLVARLSKLIMPEDAPESVLLSHSSSNPGDWPTVDIKADELIVDDILLGQMKLGAIQKQEGWQVENLAISHSDSTLQASGLWENHKPPYRVFSHIQLQSGNIGKFFKRHHYPDRVARGEGTLSGDLEWTGKPFAIDFPTLSGKLQLDAKHGQFTGLKPGIGRLLGIFDLKSLPRRLMLDFYDVFGKGFGFDELSGHIVVQSGIASTHDLYIAGSSAELVLSGEWDLVNETQALNLKVFPSFGLVTPIAGIAAMIASGTLQDPFDRVLLNEYTITGSWGDPIVVKLGEDENQIRQPEDAQP